MEIQAKVTRIFPAEEFSKKDGSGTFRLRKVWVIEVGIEYPQDLELTFMSNALLIPDALRERGEYIFSCGITGRKWVKADKSGINMGLRCWAARGMDAAPGQAQAEYEAEYKPAGGAANGPDADLVDDLPF